MYAAPRMTSRAHTNPTRKQALAGVFTLALAAASSLSGANECIADDAPVAESAQNEKWQKVYQGVAASITMQRGEQALYFHSVPLLFYTNPVRTNDQHGAIFLWTEKGRPAVLGSIWSGVTPRTDATLRNVTHEWHSLLEDADVRATRSGEQLWKSGEVGIAWQTLAGAPVPSESRATRLVQMRALARRLSAKITEEDRQGELRLMAQPLYRYPTDAAGAVDGALFVYCLATDPELILLVEVREEKGRPAYHVALARFGNLAMTVADGKRAIWSCERGKPGRSDGKYHLKWRAEQMPAQQTQEARQ
jgi:hypothetical protein